MAIRLTQLATTLGLKLRIGIHAGEVEIIYDLNGNRNICGDAINVAQRVMNAANDGQVLLSGDFIRQHIGKGNIQLQVETRCFTVKADRMVQIFVKHGRVIEVAPAVLHDDQEQPAPGWDSSEPFSFNELPIHLTDLPKEIVNLDSSGTAEESFAERLSKARSIALIQLTGERLLSEISGEKIKLSEHLEKLWVLMPHPETIKPYDSSSPLSQLQKLEECIEGWRKVLMEIQTRHPSASIYLGLFKQPPFLGGSFLDWGQDGGAIHISPYVWGLAAKDCPGFDLERRGRDPHPVVFAYIRGLEALRENTPNDLCSDK